MKKIALLIVSCLLSGCVALYSPYKAEEFQLGKAYFKKGDYKEAYHTLFPIAVCGCAEAQYAVGYLIYYGYGVERDADIGMFWVKRAADQHYEPAIKAMNAMIKAYSNTAKLGRFAN